MFFRVPVWSAKSRMTRKTRISFTTSLIGRKKMEGRIEVKSENEGILEKERAIGMQKKRVKWKYTHREGEMIVVRNATQERPCTKNDL